MRVAVAMIILTSAVLVGCMDEEGRAPEPTIDPPSSPFTMFLGPGDNLSSLGSPTPRNWVATNTAGPANELSFAVNPKDPLNIIGGGKDYHLGTDHPCVTKPSGTQGYPINVWSGVYWSKDGGRTWKNALMPGHPADSANATHPNRAWSCVSDPVIVFDEAGTAYYSGLGIWGDNVPKPTHPCVQTGRSIWIMKSSDGGETWNDFSCVAGSTYGPATGGYLLDKQWFDVDGQNVYFTYVNFNPTEVDLTFKRSRDGGRTWDPELYLIETPSSEAPDAPAGGRQFATPQVGPDGAIYVTWHSFGSDNGVYFTKSTDQGTTFAPPRRIFGVQDIPGQFFNDGYRTGTYPVLAVDDSSGPHAHTLYVVWADARNDDADVMLSKSTDKGATWSEAVKVNNDTGKGVQFLPWVATGPDGTLAVLWLDSRAYENETRLDAYLRVSRDGGATWDPELKVNETPIETEACHHQNGSNFIGDYLAVTLSQDAIYAFWPDGALGRCEAMSATILR